MIWGLGMRWGLWGLVVGSADFPYYARLNTKKRSLENGGNQIYFTVNQENQGG